MTSGEGGEDFAVIQAAKRLAQATSAAEASSLIVPHRLPRSWVPDSLIGEPEVWAALLEGMTYAEVLSNLGNMTVSGWVAPGSEGEARVAERLADPSRIRRSRSCILSLMSEAQSYLMGGWSSSRKLVAALEAAVEELLKQIEKRDRRIWLGVDASPSMSSGSLSGASITPRQAAFGLAAAAERMGELVRVSALGDKVKPLVVPRRDVLRESLEASQECAIGASNCALPMIQAATARVPVDVFLVVTDEAAWPGDLGPVEALHRYREAMDIPAALVLVSLRGKPLPGGLKDDPASWHLSGWDSSTCRAIEAALDGC
jgi:60 kDa SS-A/Ro ribonucleoprotein